MPMRLVAIVVLASAAVAASAAAAAASPSSERNLVVAAAAAAARPSTTGGRFDVGRARQPVQHLRQYASSCPLAFVGSSARNGHAVQKKDSVESIAFPKSASTTSSWLQPRPHIVASPILSAVSRSEKGESASSPSSQSSTSSLYRHTLAILTLPRTSADQIANDAILETAMGRTSHRLSVVLRGTPADTSSNASSSPSFVPTLSQLRMYVGDLYTSAWDNALAYDSPEMDSASDDDDDGGSSGGPSANLLDVIVYPANLPNAAPEGWITLRPDLDCICSHDSLIGWTSPQGGGTGALRQNLVGMGCGGLAEHVEVVNADRAARGLEVVEALSVDPWPVGAEVKDDGHVVFLEDTQEMNRRRWDRAAAKQGSAEEEDECEVADEEEPSNGSGGWSGQGRGFTGGARISDSTLYDSVAVGGTFDGMHYGHRKLLTLAVSSVRPVTGKLLVGITEDEMLRSKSFAELIPPLEERIRGVRDFLDNLAPGMKNRMRIVPIRDAYGPPGAPASSESKGGVPNDFDALVLSHETLPNGLKLNEHRVNNLGMEPLMLLCTRRTEPHGMSSTALRRLRKNAVRTEANMI